MTSLVLANLHDPCHVEGNPGREHSFVLRRNQVGQLGLLALHHPRFGAVYADWLSSHIKRRISDGGRQPLTRAVGLRKGRPLRVLDVTAGLGRDAYTLAALGAQVTLIERHSLIFQLLHDEQMRVFASQPQEGPASRIQIIHGDSNAELPIIGTLFDVIYLDPMYPEHIKSALPSKEMQVLRELTGGDVDSQRLLGAALNTGKRVVVKRSCRSAWLGPSRPSTEIRGTQVRFDVYLYNAPKFGLPEPTTSHSRFA